MAKSRCRPNQAASAHDVTLNAGPPRWLANLSPAPLGLFRTAIPRPSADWSIVTIRAGRAARAVKKSDKTKRLNYTPVILLSYPLARSVWSVRRRSVAATTVPRVAALTEGIAYAVSRLVDDWKSPRGSQLRSVSSCEKRSNSGRV